MRMRLALVRAGILGSVVLALSRCSSDGPARSGLSADCVVNSDCNNPLQCSFGLCHKACKETRDCPANQHCLKLPEGPVCQLQADTVQCVYSSQCPSPLKCAVDSKCRVPCEASGDCLPSQLCTQFVCADKDEVDPDSRELPVTNKIDPWEGTQGGDAGPTDAGNGGSTHGSGGASNRPDAAPGAGGASGAASGGKGSGGKGSGGKSNGEIDAGGGPPTCGDAGVSAFHPSNLPASPVIPGGLIALDDTRNYFDTGNPAPNPKAPAWGTVYTPIDTQQTVVKLKDGREAAVLWVSSMSMAIGSKFVVKGTRPLIIVSAGTVDINGTITAEADVLRGWFAGGASATTTLARAGACAIDTELGGGRAGLSDGSKGIGPGGGGFCGLGGPGSTDLMGTARPAGGGSYGSKELVPLVGGSAGGSGSTGNGGHGGGAVQIVSGVGIVIGEAGVINMGGGGGGYVGGGGSGGAILLEAPSVTVRGVLAANGGSGGDVYAGEDGPASAEPAAVRGVGGLGAAGDASDGKEGNTAPTKLNTAGGGGGGGRIRINTGCGGMLVVSANAIISPSTKTGCYTTGDLP
jgi:hypothetical protein